jgi:pimeloyl-ACP methyl ester carboxylesterase
MKLCFLHGLDSSPQGTKASFLRAYDPRCWIPNLPPDINERLKVLEHGLREPMLIVGSSLGGLTALMYAMSHPEMVHGLVLLAPAVGIKIEGLFTAEHKGIISSVYIPQGIPTKLIVGLRDEVIPLDSIRAMIERSPDPGNIQLLEVDDDHDLHQSLDLMLQSIERIRERFIQKNQINPCLPRGTRGYPVK